MKVCFSFALAVLTGMACGKTSTQALLDADLIISGRSAIKLSTPANSATVLSESSLVFSWADVPGVGAYLIEIADSADFSNTIISKQVNTNEYPFQRSDLKSGVTFVSNTYYWRVSVANGKGSLRSDPWTANLIFDTAYFVDCAYTGTSYGTRSAPYKAIQTGLDAALASRAGVTAATAEVRVAKGTCNESIILRANVLLKGGYDQTQNWARNPATYQTVLTSANAVAVQGFADLSAAHTSTLMEGFKIQTTNTGTANNHSAYLILANATFKNNYFVYSTVTAAASPGVSAMYITGGNVTLNSNIFRASSTSTNGVHLFGALIFDTASVTATNNIFFSTSSTAVIPQTVYGFANAPGNLVFNATNNIIFAAPNTVAGTLLAMHTQGGGTFTGIFERNLIYLLASSISMRCGQQTNPTYFTSFKKNALVDCNQNTNSLWYAYNQNLETGYPTTAGSWNADANAAGSGVAIDTVSSRGLAGNSFAGGSDYRNPVNCNGVCAAMSGNRAGNTKPGPSGGSPTFPGDPTVIFQGYVAGDPTTFTFKPNTIADMDNNGSYDATIDAGANTATAGLVALP